MYAPEHFKETDPERLETLIRDYPFGTLVTVDSGLPFANHIPFLFERRVHDTAVVLGHVARANPQWHHLAAAQTALVVFQGSHAYVSPSWYRSPGVPTWNYAVVHVYGRPRILPEGETEALLQRLTEIYEADQPTPWSFDLTGERRAKLLSMIVGFELRIEKIEGKFKLSQNRSAEDQQAVIHHLTESAAPLGSALARLMRINWQGRR